MFATIICIFSFLQVLDTLHPCQWEDKKRKLADVISCVVNIVRVLCTSSIYPTFLFSAQQMAIVVYLKSHFINFCCVMAMLQKGNRLILKAYNITFTFLVNMQYLFLRQNYSNFCLRHNTKKLLVMNLHS